jgi:ubiquinone biosynthesis protein COQ9
MSDQPKKTETDHLTEARAKLLAAALAHVPFDGWSQQSLDAALADTAIDADLARLALPRGALDLAIAHHKQGDAEMLLRALDADLESLRYSEKVAALIRLRLEIATDKEIVRRGATFFAMPGHAAEGSALIWDTCDVIWTCLGDTSTDVNWYSKRVILSAVYSSTLLYWLGDDSPGHQATWEFLARRIENVMKFEKAKGSLRKNPLVKGLMRGPGRLLDRITAPDGSSRADLPGHIAEKTQ